MLPRNAIYLDANAGTPLRAEVYRRLSERLSESASGASVLLSNPSSIHSHGREARRWVSEAREAVCRSLGPPQAIHPEQIVFTSSGSESNQLVIRAVLEKYFRAGEPVHWITSPVEHDSTLQMKQWVEDLGGAVEMLSVDASGVPRLEELEEKIRPGETRLVSCIWVNNETGAITPVASYSDFIRDSGVPFHLDAAQAWGKIPIDSLGIGASYLTFSGHKIGAPAGIGLVWMKKGAAFEPLIRGHQELGRRGGTENLIGILCIGFAAEAMDSTLWDRQVRPLRDRLEEAIRDRVPGAILNAAQANRVGNTSNFSFEGIRGETLVMALDLEGYSVSSGSACASGVLEPSHVLLAMGRSPELAEASVRISLWPGQSWTECEGLVNALEKTIERARPSG